MEDEQSTAPQEVSQAENPAEDQILSILSDTEGTEESQEESPAEETPEEEVSEPEAEPPAEKQTEESEELQAEDDPKEVARRQYEERQRLRAEREERIRQVTDPYVNEAIELGDEVEARLRNMEADRYMEKVERVAESLVSEFERAKADPDLQIFNPESESFNRRAYDKALRDYNAGYIQYDSNNNMVGLKGSLIEHLKETAELLSSAQKTGAVQQVRATRTMRNNADTKPAATPKAPEKDPILEILQSD